jgi:alkyl hydroperoxide reductase subunit AhpC
MTLQLGQLAPDFEQESTHGKIRFHEWLGNSWCVLFSHPKDFTPVCTTELGEVARLRKQWEARNVKVIGLSVDPVDSHQEWESDIEATQGHAVNFPMLADADQKVSQLYNMIHPEWLWCMNENSTISAYSVAIETNLIGPACPINITPVAAITSAS